MQQQQQPEPTQSPSAAPAVPHCALCGWIFVLQKGLRRVPWSELRRRVKKEWMPGPIVYRRIMMSNNSEKEEHDGPEEEEHGASLAEVCSTCIKRPGNGTAMLPMDAFLLHLMSPTLHLDQRRYQRMKAVLLCSSPSHPGARNPYALPEWLMPERSSTFNSTVLAWWNRNLRTHFFRSKATARAVRVALREP